MLATKQISATHTWIDEDTALALSHFRRARTDASDRNCKELKLPQSFSLASNNNARGVTSQS